MTAPEFQLFFNNLCVSRASHPACTGHERRSPCLEVSQIGSLLQHCRRLRKPCISHWSPVFSMEAISEFIYPSPPSIFVTSPVAVLIREAHQNGLGDLLGAGHGALLRWNPPMFPQYFLQTLKLKNPDSISEKFTDFNLLRCPSSHLSLWVHPTVSNIKVSSRKATRPLIRSWGLGPNRSRVYQLSTSTPEFPSQALVNNSFPRRGLRVANEGER